MKLRLLLAVAALMVGSVAFAQQGEGRARGEGRERGERPTVEQIAKCKSDRMKKELSLNEQQYTKVYKLYLKQAKRQAKMWRKGFEQQRAFKADVKLILTEEQFAKYEQGEKARREQWQRRGKGKRGDGPRGDRPRGEWKRAERDGNGTPVKGEKMPPIRPKDNPRGEARNGAYME